MAKLAEEVIFGDLTSYNYPATYDPDQLGLGPLMVQKTGGTTAERWAGPIPNAITRPMEQSTAIASAYPWAIQWSDTIDWVFTTDIATATTTRRVSLYTFDRTTSIFSWQGFVTVTPPSGTNHTVRGFRMTYDTYSTGTVEVSTTTVTGTGTAWQTARFAVGGRIGFGSTDPTQISTWYEITAIGSDTGITIGASAGTIGAGSAFVIEELRVVLATTASVTTNGGLFVAKGLNYSTFTSGGTTIAAAASTDNVRATYWLADAATVTNTVAAGVALEDKASNTVHYAWVLNGSSTTLTLYKYNLRAALTLSSGKDTTAIQLVTGGATTTGNVSQANNGRQALVSSGPGSGIVCIYLATTTRIYRTVELSTIIASSTTFLADAMTEVTPGTTFAVTGTMSWVEYAGTIDKFFIGITTTNAKPYITQYKTDASALDRSCFLPSPQGLSSAANINAAIYPSRAGVVFSGWIESGLMYLLTHSASSTTNFLYSVPIGADWEYASTTNCRIIVPKMATTNCYKFLRVLVTEEEIIGQTSGNNLGSPPDACRIYYRTVDIDDDSGAWTLVDFSGDLSGVSAAEEIQFMIEFRTIGEIGIPARIHSIAVIYQDEAGDQHYQPSVAFSDVTNKVFAWRFKTAFGSSVPDLRIILYDADTDSVLVDDDTDTPTGTFERSTNDGSSWSAWNNTDLTNTTTYIRYTPASLGDDIKVRAVLTLL